MRVPASWLRDYVPFDVSVEELAERMSMSGTKVEAIHHRGVPAGLELYRVGRVVSREQHPNADRLSLCTVDVGEGEPRRIVCGASNFQAGDTVAVALPGATLPDGTVLEKAVLRGVESDGMMLSERELELSGDHQGIMLLDGSARPGSLLADVLPIAETVIEFEVTPNRPDCLSVYGIAREAAATLDVPLAPWPGVEPEPTGAGTVADYVTARVDALDLCPRWAGRVFTDITVAPSPAWLKARISAAGMRPISNVVDISNYVMLCVGEPTHTFDLDRVAGREIIVRRARDGERIVTLDGQERILDSDIVVIADAEKPSAIGGLMGSEWSEVHEGTTTVLLECANFDGPSAHRASSRLGLRTEGSTRWEKGLDPHLVPRALALASQLLVEVCGARLVPGTVDVHGELPEPPLVPLRPGLVERVVGVRYEPEEIARILGRLGYASEDGRWRVPTWRAADTPREIDLVEEVARIGGLDRVPALLPPHAAAVGGLTREQTLRERVVEVLLGAGFSEAATTAFTDPDTVARLRLAGDDPRARPIALRNPMAKDQGLMRTLVFPSLLQSVHRNLAAGAPGVALFEIAGVYLPSDAELPDEPLHLSAVMAGPGAGFLELKGALEVLLRVLRVPIDVRPAAEPFLHPGRSARAGELGFLGELHPLVAEAFDVDTGVVVMELDLGALLARVPAAPQYRDVVSFPPVRQDIAVIVADDVPAGDVVEAAREAGGEVLTAVDVFDVYTGPQVGERRKSLALHLTFQAPDRTLTDAEADAMRDRVVAALRDRFGAELRG